MPTGPAARITDMVVHPTPPKLLPGPGSVNVLIGFLPAWRGLPLAAVAGLMAAKTVADTAINVATAASAAAAGPAFPAVYAAEQAARASAAASMASMMSGLAAGGTDIHLCTMPIPPTVPHGPGMVIDGSATVQTNFMPQCRLGDTIIEAIAPAPNKIVTGEFQTIVGG
jgi:uncharacterized Zn-binding protein involved in type VI secretion